MLEIFGFILPLFACVNGPILFCAIGLVILGKKAYKWISFTRYMHKYQLGEAPEDKARLIEFGYYPGCGWFSENNKLWWGIYNDLMYWDKNNEVDKEKGRV